MKKVISLPSILAVLVANANVAHADSSCVSIKYRGTWVGECLDKPGSQEELVFPANGSCNDLNYRADSLSWKIGQSSVASQSIPSNTSSHSPFNSLRSATWSERDQTVTLYQAISVMSTSLAPNEVSEFGSQLIFLTLTEDGRLVEKELLMQSNGRSITDRNCEYRRLK